MRTQWFWSVNLVRDDRLILIENVPVGVCAQCGERYILPDVAERIDQLLESHEEPDKTIEVPVYQFRRQVA